MNWGGGGRNHSTKIFFEVKGGKLTLLLSQHIAPPVVLGIFS